MSKKRKKMSKEKEERSEFENWYKSKWPQPLSEHEFIWSIRRDASGEYIEQDVLLAWEAWQAARELPIC